MKSFQGVSFVIFIYYSGVVFIGCDTQVQTVTARHHDTPDFLTEATSASVTETPSTISVTTEKTAKEKEDELRYKSVTGKESAKHWKNLAQSNLRERQRIRPIEKVAKNIIYFVGDGMSVPTVAGARIFKGQSEGLHFGEEAQLHMETFPFLGASKTFCSDAQVADSACSATALFTGSKTNIKTIGVTPDVSVGDCFQQMQPENQLSSILEWAQKEGKSTGIVTTTRITHATPAGCYSRIAHRDWENDVEITKAGQDPEKCDDIAEQLILREPGRNINVILGGGRKHLLPSTEVDFESKQNGSRNDSKNLIEMWKAAHANQTSQYVDRVETLLNVDTKNLDYLLGLFAPDHIEYSDNITTNHDPTLLNMTTIAIRILSKNPNGFFLMVEGGRIDHALHENFGKRALLEAVEFDSAIARADEMTDDDDTLITVTSDHSHVMSIAGYPIRGNPILAVAENSDIDGLPYTTISFANGPGFRNQTSNGLRPNVSEDDLMKIDYRQFAGLPSKYETHGGDDVFIFSKGPYAHYLTGVNLQNYIPHVMAYAACIGPAGMEQSPLCNEIRSTSASARLTNLNISLQLVLLAALSANRIICSFL
ncbi:Alkaline phosphatase, tissue-nonspecific isozyme [Orchesella cincta]|uniref:Alkaline phosphatase n=1 Tax=Orchesella cincta TaxID=48709 RepID=A0A1D2NKV0_ORCCI|nr:Alkaline phosphatase, tissue-nonspecific isozyme [Orchesella cincta]